MDSKLFAAHLIKIAERYNTSKANIEKLVVKICSLSMKYVEREMLWNALFEDDFVDWELVKNRRDNILGDITSWITLMDLMDWKHLEKSESTIHRDFPMLVDSRKHLRECSLDPGKAEGWNMVCKTKILTMVLGLPTLPALETFTCAVFKRSTSSETTKFLALQSEQMYTPLQQLEVLTYILKEVKVQTQVIEQNLALHQAQRADIKLHLQVSRMQVLQGRPRLRDRLQDRIRVESIHDSWETFTGFCYKHQFPPTLSDSIKHKLYFMASQTQWNWIQHLPKVAPGAVRIYEKISEFPVTQPDLTVIIKVIEEMSMDGRPPFNQLNQFRSKCFQSFALSQVQRMTFTQFLQLYLAAYQNKKIWKEVWKHLIGVISVQIIRDCEAFVEEFPFDANAFMEIF